MEIHWTEIAVKHLDNTLDYLEYKWGSEVAKNFLHKLNATIDMVIHGNVVHQNYADMKDVKKVLVTKHNTLIYEKYNNEILYILGIINNFKDPDSNYKEIENNKKTI